MYEQKNKFFSGITFINYYLLNDILQTKNKNTLALLEKNKNSANEREKVFLWPKVREYRNIHKHWNIPDDKIQLGELSDMTYQCCRSTCSLY